MEYLPNVSNLDFVESLYQNYLHNPASLSLEWRQYFDELTRAEDGGKPSNLTPSFRPRSIFNPLDGRNGSASEEERIAGLQDRVGQLIRNYRVRGHNIAHLDPLDRPMPHLPELEPGFYGFTEADMERRFFCESIHPGCLLPLREILERLRNTYCRSIGVQFMHIDELAAREWLQQRMEATQNRIQLSSEQQLRILTHLTDAVIFEEFIRRKFIGAKSFSLEGGETLIPLLDLAIDRAARQGIEEIVIGMAHRGRLNVLANVMGKSPREIFREFEDKETDSSAAGDVKYHLGYYNLHETAGGRTIYLALGFNPSHLEFVSPVALGRMRAKQDRVNDARRERGMVFLIHGDASFAGEGIVQETLNLSQLDGYTTGGALHIVVNNQIGFTTEPHEARSSVYATDMAKMLQSPIFHVNGEDPEAVAQVVSLAMDFRQAFKRDVVIDMYCYRRLGHNEADEPGFTQPLMYRLIAKRPSVRDSYLDHLLTLGGVTREQAQEISAARLRHLEAELSVAHRDAARAPDKLGGIWNGYRGGPENGDEQVPTAVERSRLTSLLQSLVRLPEGFHVHPKIKRGLEMRRRMGNGEIPLDWSAGEALAFATLAAEGTRVRLTGQDSARGTFSHRHAVLHDVEDGIAYVPLQHVAADQAPVDIYNSPLSEAGVLGFEYGYSIGCPDGLVLWEAQFGDFINAAQVYVDQFITSAEQKWRRLSGIVLLLPHGLEGMGPEHSSARVERFLQLAVEDNIQVVNPTTPAQYFHCLRRQSLRKWRKPLVVMTPKSLLRHPRVVSPLDDFAAGGFQRIIPDGLATADIAKVILCSGKIYYELEHKRAELERNDVAILRIEQLYPLRSETLAAALKKYMSGIPVLWIQEEPENMGAWPYLKLNFGDELLGRFPFLCVSRPRSGSPATGSAARHKSEQEQLLAKAFSAA